MSDDNVVFRGMDGVRQEDKDVRQRRHYRRWRYTFVGIGLGFLLLALFVVDSSWPVLSGLAGGDRFYGGMPSRYWAGRIKRDRPETIDRLVAGGETAVPVLAELLDHPDAEVRAGAAEAASRMAGSVAGVVPLLVRALGDPERHVWICAVLGVKKIAPNVKEAVPPLIALLEKPELSPEDVDDLAEALGKYGPEAKDAVPLLLRRIPDGRDETFRNGRSYKWLAALDPAAVRRLVAYGGDGRGLTKVHLLADGYDPVGLSENSSGNHSIHLGSGGSWQDWFNRVENFAILPGGQDVVVLAGNGNGGCLFREPFPPKPGPHPPTWEVKAEGSLLGVSPDGKVVVAGSIGGPLRAYDAATGQQTTSFALTALVARAYLSVGFSPNGDLVVGCETFDRGYRVVVLDTATGKTKHDFAPPGSPQQLSFSPDGARLAAAALLGETVRVWDLSSGAQTDILTGSEQVCPFVFLPGGALAAVSGRRGADIGVWDVATGKLVRELKWHRGQWDIRSLSVSADGKVLASCDSAGWIRFWDLPPTWK